MLSVSGTKRPPETVLVIPGSEPDRSWPLYLEYWKDIHPFMGASGHWELP
jgi:hypothetical protein